MSTIEIDENIKRRFHTMTDYKENALVVHSESRKLFKGKDNYR